MCVSIRPILASTLCWTPRPIGAARSSSARTDGMPRALDATAGQSRGSTEAASLRRRLRITASVRYLKSSSSPGETPRGDKEPRRSAALELPLRLISTFAHSKKLLSVVNPLLSVTGVRPTPPLTPRACFAVRFLVGSFHAPRADFFTAAFFFMSHAPVLLPYFED